MTISVTSLFSVSTLEQILDVGLSVARVLSVPVTSWRSGDPTKALFHFLATVLAERETVASEFIKSGFLSTATGDWLTVVAEELYGVDRPAATAATSTITLSNTTGRYYNLAAGEVTVLNASTGATYHSTAALVLPRGETATLTVEADEPGSAGSAVANDIDTIVSTMLGVSITASTLATGTDALDDTALRTLCRATLGALSPNGPPDAYEYVALTPTLSLAPNVTRAAAVEDSTYGLVTLYVAGNSGPVSGADVTAVQTAVNTWAKPLCIQPTVVNTSASPITVTATVTGEDIPAAIDTLCETALGAYFRTILLGAQGGVVSLAAIYRAILGAAEDAGASNVTVAISAPTADTELTTAQVATLGTVTVTEV